MEKDFVRLENILEKNMPSIIDAIEKADPTTETYKELLNNFNSSMVIYSQLQEMFMRAAQMQAATKEENNNGTNN
jgi:hypothetical protein